MFRHQLPMGMLEQGEDGEDVAAILYVNLIFMMQPLINVSLTFGTPFDPFPLDK
jgi:hypothetical protein